MLDLERLQAEVEAIGFTLIEVDQGIPVCEETLSKAEEALVIAVIEDHVGNPADYLAADLDKTATKIKALATSGQFTSYKAIQDTVKAETNRMEFSKTVGLFLEWQYAVETSDPTAAAKKTAWMNAMAGIPILSAQRIKEK